MKDIDDMRIGESFYLKMTVAVISTRNGKPCEFDEERIDINDLIIAELEKIKGKIIACTQQEEGEVPACINYGIKLSTEIVEKHIAELKGKQE